MKMNLRSVLFSAGVAAASLLPLAAHAAEKPTICVLHRNAAKAQDEANWQRLANGLSRQGYQVVSVAMGNDEDAATGRDHVLKAVSKMREHSFVVVGTASVHQTVNLVARSAPKDLRAVLYVTATDGVPAFGPQEIDVPADLATHVYQVRVTEAAQPQEVRENGHLVFLVREEGRSTLARIDDLQRTIDRVSRMNPA